MCSSITTMSAQRKSSCPLLLALLLASLALTNAQAGYGDPRTPVLPSPGVRAPPPPFAVKGKEFPPESTLCFDIESPCYGKVITCPVQCPQFKPSDPNAKGCFIDCINPKCEAVCKTRLPNCEGIGAGCYDPRFVGGDGLMFYFHGKANHHFALLSDPNLHINARFIGLRPAGRPRDFTWIQSLAVLFGPHSFTLSADSTAVWDPTADHLSFSFDGHPLFLDDGHLSAWSSGALQLERTATVNSVTVTLPNVFEIMATAVPVTAEDDRIHKYGIPAGDCFAHLEVQFKFFGLSEKVEGVLGQTYRPDFKNPVKRGVAMPVMSGEERYEVDSLLSAECKYCMFSPAAEENYNSITTAADAATLNCGGKMSNGYQVVCRR